VGTGSAGLLMDAVAHACAGSDDATVVSFERAFVVYRLAARNAGADYLEAPTGGAATPGRDGYARDVDDLLALVDERTRAVLVDNPGNPTGAHLTGEQLTRLVEGVPERTTVVVDEAYHDFAAGQRGYATVAELGLDHPRLVVTRTFSKAHALAGLRVGYVVGPADLVADLDAWRVRFNVTATAQAAALASLDDEEHVAACVRQTLQGRERMASRLRELGVPFTDGLGNFLTIELGCPAAEVVEDFARRGIGVRPLAPYSDGRDDPGQRRHAGGGRRLPRRRRRGARRGPVPRLSPHPRVSPRSAVGAISPTATGSPRSPPRCRRPGSRPRSPAAAPR
jgi:histidinol-phosphate aminotransferase